MKPCGILFALQYDREIRRFLVLCVILAPACGRWHFDPLGGDGGGDDGMVTPHRETYLKASDTAAGATFGVSVAMSTDGSTIAVGAQGAAADAGVVYVFVRAGTTWAQQARLQPAITDPGDGFGHAVALSADGNTLVVGAQGEGSGTGDAVDNSAGAAGAAYVFVRSNTTWTQNGYLKAQTIDVDDELGTSVAISGDGSTIAVGEIGEDSNATGVGGNMLDNTLSGAGAVLVFVRSPSTWIQQAYLKPSNTHAGEEFGTNVGLSFDGAVLAVGADSEASAATGVGGDQGDRTAPGAGAVYMFRRGTSWAQEAYVKASNTEAVDRFSTLALSPDGNALAVGAFGEDSAGADPLDNSLNGAGAVYVFSHLTGSWAFDARLKPEVTHVMQGFGISLGFVTPTRLVIGAPGDPGASIGFGGDATDASAPGAGAVFVFDRSQGLWAETNYVKASNTDAMDQFGTALGVSSTGFVTGAEHESSAATGVDGDGTNNAAMFSGAAYVVE